MITGAIRSVEVSVPSTCKTQLLCAMYDPEQKQSQPSAFLENRNAGTLTVAQAVYEAPVSGVTPFEDCILSREASKTYNGAQRLPDTPQYV